MQLLMFAILAFMLLVKYKLYPAEVRSTNLDVDWLWRKPGLKLVEWAVPTVAALWHRVWGQLQSLMAMIMRGLADVRGPNGSLSRDWTVGRSALSTAIVLAAVLILVFIN